MQTNFERFVSCMQQSAGISGWGKSLPAGPFSLPALIDSRFNRLGNGIIGSFDDMSPQDPILISPEEFVHLLGGADFLSDEFLNQFRPFYQLREQKELGLGYDDYWGLIDPPNALMVVCLAKRLASRSQERIRVLVLGTGVGLLEKVLLDSNPKIEIVTVDITSDSQSGTPKYAVDAKNMTYQVKSGQHVGMCIPPDELDEFSGRAQMVTSDALAYLANDHGKFDMIVVDDNHIASHVKEEVQLILDNEILAPDGVLFLDNISFPGTTGPAVAALTQIVPTDMFVMVTKKDGPGAACGFYIASPVSNYLANCARR